MKLRLKINLAYFKQVLFYSSIIFLPTQLNKYFFGEYALVNGVRKDLLAVQLSLSLLIILLFISFYLKQIASLAKKKQVLLFVFFSAVNLFFSINKVTTAYKLFLIYALICYIFAVLQFKKEKLLNQRLLLISLLFMLAPQLFLAVYQFLAGKSFGSVFYFLGERALSLTGADTALVYFYKELRLRPYATFSHPNSMAGFMLMLVVFLLYKIKPETGFDSLLRVLAVLIASGLVLISFSKTAILGLVLLLFVYFIKNLSCWFCFISRVIVLVIFSLVFLLTPFLSSSVAERLVYAGDSFLILKTFFWFGSGLGGYLSALANIFPERSTVFLQPVHNIFFLFLAETGFVGFLFVLLEFWLSKKTVFFFLKKNLPFVFIIGFLGLFDHYFLSLNQNLFSLIFIFL